MKLTFLLLAALCALLASQQVRSETVVHFNFEGMIPAPPAPVCDECDECELCEECETCDVCDVCETCKACSFILIGSTTAEPLANAVSDALTNSSSFPCLGAVRPIGTTAGYAASFAGVEVGLGSRDPRSSEISAIFDPASVKLFAFGRTSTCFVVSSKDSNTVKTSWTKSELCTELKANEGRQTRFIGHSSASTHVQRVATGCDVSVDKLRFDEVVNTLTVTSSVAEWADNWAGVIPADELQPYLDEGNVTLIEVDGKTCLDAHAPFGSSLWFVVNQIESELSQQFLTIAREALRNFNAASFGLAVDPDAVGVAPNQAISVA